jgi:hypothetical protein
VFENPFPRSWKKAVFKHAPGKKGCRMHPFLPLYGLKNNDMERG